MRGGVTPSHRSCMVESAGSSLPASTRDSASAAPVERGARAGTVKETDMASDVTAISVVAQPSRVGACALCARGETVVQAAVLLQRAGGASVSFDACDYCVRAMRRVAAASSGLARFVDGGLGARAPEPVPVASGVEEREALRAELLHEFHDPLQDADGVLYVPRAVGAERGDGTWIGWLEFVSLDGRTVLRTNRETTQPNRGAVAYWAAGLETTYMEGAFRLARRPHVVSTR
jgi:hypothetical protein